MPRAGRLTLRDRLFGVGLHARIIAAAAVLVLGCGGFLAYRSVAALGDAYRFTSEAEAYALANSFARSLSSRDVADIDRVRHRIARLSGVHPDLTDVSVLPPARGGAHAAYRRDEHAAVLLAALGAGLLLVIGVGALSRLLLVRPVERLSRNALLVAAGTPGHALGWGRRDAIGSLAGAIDTLGGTMRALQTRIDGLVLKDPLTGVLNHRGLHDALHEALERASKRGEKVAVVALDIDNFEQLNASAGHGAGDEALRIAARVMLGELRPGDVCGRVGGDEFLLALPDSDAWGAERVVERLRGAIATAAISEGRSRLSFSAGIAEFPRDARNQQDLMRLADGALYRAKRSGRNRCVVYSSFVDAPLSLQEEAERARTAGLANTVYALARAVDLKDGYTHQHSTRVAQYAAVLARELGMSEEEIDQSRTAGILHDVGKVGVADAVLLKPARLTDDEFLEMQRHSMLGRDIVQGAGMPEIAEWVLYLHERWDGRGYPHRLEGDDIPLASRVLGVADAFEAMTSSRLYRRGMPVEKALQELEKSSGEQFDPAVAQRLVDLIRSGAIPLGEIGVLDVTHYGSAACSESAAPPEEEGEPVRNVAEPDLPRGAKRAARGRDSSARANSAS